MTSSTGIIANRLVGLGSLLATPTGNRRELTDFMHSSYDRLAGMS
jgi:hypothetical protein